MQEFKDTKTANKVRNSQQIILYTIMNKNQKYSFDNNNHKSLIKSQQ